MWAGCGNSCRLRQHAPPTLHPAQGSGLLVPRTCLERSGWVEDGALSPDRTDIVSVLVGARGTKRHAGYAQACRPSTACHRALCRAYAVSGGIIAVMDTELLKRLYRSCYRIIMDDAVGRTRCDPPRRFLHTAAPRVSTVCQPGRWISVSLDGGRCGRCRAASIAAPACNCLPLALPDAALFWRAARPPFFGVPPSASVQTPAHLVPPLKDLVAVLKLSRILCADGLVVYTVPRGRGHGATHRAFHAAATLPHTFTTAHSHHRTCTQLHISAASGALHRHTHGISRAYRAPARLPHNALRAAPGGACNGTPRARLLGGGTCAVLVAPDAGSPVRPSQISSLVAA